MKLWSTIAAIASCVFISQSALALSCAPPDMIKTLEDAKSSEDVYHVLVGKFITPIAPALTKNPKGYKVIQKGSGPIQRFTHSKEPKITATFFEGYALTPDASGDAPLTAFPVDVQTRCLGPWCSHVPSSEHDVIAFVKERQGQSPILVTSPCPGKTFGADPERVSKLRQCLTTQCEADFP